MPARRLVATVIALLTAVAVAACADVSLGAVQVTVTMDGEPSDPLGAAEFRVRLLGADGSIRNQAIPWPGGVGLAIPVPAGTYRAEVWTVYYSDATVCEPDPGVPGGQRCTTDTSTDRPCELEFEIESGIVGITYRTGAEDWGCVIEGPAPS